MLTVQRLAAARQAPCPPAGNTEQTQNTHTMSVETHPAMHAAWFSVYTADGWEALTFQTLGLQELLFPAVTPHLLPKEALAPPRPTFLRACRGGNGDRTLCDRPHTLLPSGAQHPLPCARQLHTPEQACPRCTAAICPLEGLLALAQAGLFVQKEASSLDLVSFHIVEGRVESKGHSLVLQLLAISAGAGLVFGPHLHGCHRVQACQEYSVCIQGSQGRHARCPQSDAQVVFVCGHMRA